MEERGFEAGWPIEERKVEDRRRGWNTIRPEDFNSNTDYPTKL